MGRYMFDLVVRYAVEELKGQRPTRRPSLEELNRYCTGCGDSYAGFDNTLHWCGIFATYILRKAGVRVRWARKIVDDSGGQDIKIVWGREGMGPGDVAVRDWRNVNHHFIVLDSPKSGVIWSVDGNHGGVGNPLLFCGRHGKNTVAAVDYYYRVY